VHHRRRARARRRAAGFEVVAAGKGTKYLPEYHASTPDTVWPHYGFSAETVAAGDFNAQMFNSFLDGTKSAIEMAAVANATGLTPAPGGLAFPPCGVDDLPRVLRPRADGGALHHVGQVEVISSPARSSTARAAIRCTGSSCPPRIPLRKAACRSVSHTA